MTLSVARLYIEPTLKGESGPVGDPVVSDPMHPNGVHLSHDRTLTFFFPRVRTPCGHGAQVIVEGRESQSDGGENNKDNKQKANRTPKRPTGRVSTIL